MSIKPQSTSIELWEPQIPWIDQLLRAYAPIEEGGEGHTRVVGQAPTGFGKTTCFCRVLYGTIKHQTDTVVLAHRFKLIEQISARLNSFGITHGIIAKGYPYQPWHKIQLSMIQTYVNKTKRGEVSPAELYIFDEGHHAAAATFDYIFDFAPEAHFLAVTATPERPDGKPLSKRFTKLVCGPSPRWLMTEINPKTNRSYLVPIICYSPSERLDMKGVRKGLNGDYSPSQLEAVTRKSKIVGDATRHYKQYCDGAPALAFCVSVEHAKAVAEEFSAAGIPAKAIYGALSQSQQEAIYDAFAKGYIKVITSCDMISEGVDLPEVSAIFLLRKTKSLILFLQAVGRGLRSAPGKEYCLLFDHVGLIEDFGMPDVARTWSLDGNSVIDKEADQWKQCQSCYMWIKMTARSCKACGTKCGGDGSGTPRDFTTDKEGQLSLITDEKLAKKAAIKKAEAERQAAIRKRISKAFSLKEFQQIEAEEGYKPGWSVIQWNLMQRRLRGRKK